MSEHEYKHINGCYQKSD